MVIQRFLLAAVGAAVFLIVVSMIFTPILFPEGPPESYRNNRVEPLKTPEYAALIVSAVLLAYIFPIGYKGGKRFAEGLRCGMLLGALVSLPANLRLYAAAEVRFDSLLTVIFWTIITWGISGAIIATIYGNTLEQKSK